MGSHAWLLQSRAWTSVDLHWWPCETTPKGHQGQVLALPRLRQGPTAVPTALCEPAQCKTGFTTEHTHQWTALAEEYSVAHFPVGALQPHLPHTAAKKCSSETDLGASTPTAREQTQPLTGQWQPQNEEEALLDILGRVWSAPHLSHTIKGIRASRHRGESWEASTLKAVLALKNTEFTQECSYRKTALQDHRR